jgi:hypothetical protein
VSKSKLAIFPLLLILAAALPSCRKSGALKSQIAARVREISDMSLIEIRFKKVLIFKQEKRFIFAMKDATQVMRIYPRVELGIDLNRISESDITVDESQGYIHLKLPPVGVKKFVYDERDYADTDGEFTGDSWFNTVTVETIEKMHRIAENEVRKSVNMVEWRRMCEERIKNNLRIFFANFGYRVEVEFGAPPARLMEFDPGLDWDRD